MYVTTDSIRLNTLALPDHETTRPQPETLFEPEERVQVINKIAETAISGADRSAPPSERPAEGLVDKLRRGEVSVQAVMLYASVNAVRDSAEAISDHRVSTRIPVSSLGQGFGPDFLNLARADLVRDELYPLLALEERPKDDELDARGAAVYPGVSIDYSHGPGQVVEAFDISWSCPKSEQMSRIATANSNQKSPSLQGDYVLRIDHSY